MHTGAQASSVEITPPGNEGVKLPGVEGWRPHQLSPPPSPEGGQVFTATDLGCVLTGR